MIGEADMIGEAGRTYARACMRTCRQASTQLPLQGKKRLQHGFSGRPSRRFVRRGMYIWAGNTKVGHFSHLLLSAAFIPHTYKHTLTP